MTDEQKQKCKNNQNQYKENMSDEEKQKYKEAKNKRDRDRYNKMTDEEKQKLIGKVDNQKDAPFSQLISMSLILSSGSESLIALRCCWYSSILSLVILALIFLMASLLMLFGGSCDKMFFWSCSVKMVELENSR